MDDFFFYGRHLRRPGYEKNFVVTSVSLATVLYFFIDYGGRFGVPLILSPLMFSLGTLCFLWILPILQRKGFLENGSTLHNFVGKEFSSVFLRYTTSIISILGYLGIFVIELYVGVQIFKVFNDSDYWIWIVLGLLSLLVFIFTYLGGYRAVIDTDRLQYAFIAICTVVLIGSFVAFQVIKPEVSSIDLVPLEAPWLPLSFIVVIIVGNVPFQILRMQHWQNAAAVGNLKIVKKGLQNGIWLNFFIWAAFLAIGILAYSVIPIETDGTVKILELLRADAFPFNAIVYPIVFTAFVAALISTADSIFIAILTAFVYDFALHKKLHDSNNNVLRNISVSIQRRGLKIARRSIIGFLIFGGLLYIFLTQILEFNFVSLLFVFFNQQLVLFPAVFNNPVPISFQPSYFHKWK